jgi:hypothetical protein
MIKPAYDAVIVGSEPNGLAAAIALPTLKQLSPPHPAALRHLKARSLSLLRVDAAGRRRARHVRLFRGQEGAARDVLTFSIPQSFLAACRLEVDFLFSVISAEAGIQAAL